MRLAWLRQGQLVVRPFVHTAVRSCSKSATIMVRSVPTDQIVPFQLVVAQTRDRGIGANGGMPWSLPKDMAYFKKLTATTSVSSARNAVVMGRNTWQSIPSKFRPLANRINIVISRTMATGAQAESDKPQPDAIVASFGEALSVLASERFSSALERTFVIGGGQVYADALRHPACEAVHVTEIDAVIECDTFFPELPPGAFQLWSRTPSVRCKEHRITFKCYTRTGAMDFVPSPALNSRHEEHQYLDLISDAMADGAIKGDRTGTGTRALFGRSMRFDLRDSFPLLTTKRTFWRGVAEELLWFISGSTNAKLLADKSVHIWDGNGSREFLDARGLTQREEMDLGPVYGFQWRHFGAKYTDMHADYTGQGVDQLADVIHKIKHTPDDRRIVMSAWNPADLSAMALPPCHMFVQFYVADGELSASMYQRSCDLGLGVPFNIASYALLTRLIAQVCGLKAREFVHFLGDAHVYENHVDALQEQLQNAPRAFPTLHINSAVTDIDGFKLEDLEIRDYTPHKKIAMKMAV